MTMKFNTINSGHTKGEDNIRENNGNKNKNNNNNENNFNSNDNNNDDNNNDSGIGIRPRSLFKFGGGSKRRRRESEQEKNIETAVAAQLEAMEQGSFFFKQCPPKRLPVFSIADLELGSILGMGNFGIVQEVTTIISGESNREDKIAVSNNTTINISNKIEISHSTGCENRNPQTMVQPTQKILIQHSDSTSQSTYDISGNVDTTVASEKTEQVLYMDGIDPLRVVSPCDHGSDYEDDDCNDTAQTFASSEREISTAVVLLLPSQKYAVKRVRQDLRLKKKTYAAVDLASEAKIMACLSHPNILHLRGTVANPGNKNFMLVMDRLEKTLHDKIYEWKNASTHGSFFSFLKKGKNGSEQSFANRLLIVYDIARAMAYLHQNIIIFRDLKAENVGIDLQQQIKLFDFGIAKELKKKDLIDPPDGFIATGLTGTSRIMAPEVMKCTLYGLSADVYSFAILFWEVFESDFAYQGLHLGGDHFEQTIMSGKRPGPVRNICLPQSLQRLMQKCWAADPTMRPNFQAICKVLETEIESSFSPKTLGIVSSSSSTTTTTSIHVKTARAPPPLPTTTPSSSLSGNTNVLHCEA